MRLTTHDVGIAIRDFVESQHIEVINWQSEDADGTGQFSQVVGVNVSDASNPLLTLANGQRFRIRILAEG